MSSRICRQPPSARRGARAWAARSGKLRLSLPGGVQVLGSPTAPGALREGAAHQHGAIRGDDPAAPRAARSAIIVGTKSGSSARQRRHRTCVCLENSVIQGASASQGGGAGQHQVVVRRERLPPGRAPGGAGRPPGSTTAFLFLRSPLPCPKATLSPSLRAIRWRLILDQLIALVLALGSFYLNQWVYASSDDQCAWKVQDQRVIDPGDSPQRRRRELPGCWKGMSCS